LGNVRVAAVIFLVVYLLFYYGVVHARVRLQELNTGQRGHVVRNAAVALCAAAPLGFVSPALWLLTLFVLAGYQAVRSASALRERNAVVQYYRGKGPRPASLRLREEGQ
jgi:hypothetical protein